MAQTHNKPRCLLCFRIRGDLGPLTTYTSKRGKVIFFDRAPPLNPPSPLQIDQRTKFTAAATTWRSLTSTQRQAWNEAAIRAYTKITGYNLWTWWQTIGNPETLATISRQSGITLPA